MFGNSPDEALQRYTHALNRCLALVTDSIFVGEGYRRGAAQSDLALNRNEPVLLPGNRIALRAAQSYAFVENPEAVARERWQILILSYNYRLMVPDVTSAEILAFHWHPDFREGLGPNPVAFPHLHLGAGELAGRVVSRRHHIPTSYVEFVDVLQYAIEELGIRNELSARERGSYREVFEETRRDLGRG